MNGFRETNVLVFLEEGEHVAALVTAEAMKDLAVWVDVETRALLFVERAERDEIGAGSFEREIRADDINDVAGGADLFECCRGEESSHEVEPDWRRPLFFHDLFDLAFAAPADAFVDDAAAGFGIDVDQLGGQILFDRAAGEGLFEDRALDHPERGKIDAAGPVLLRLELGVQLFFADLLGVEQRQDKQDDAGKTNQARNHPEVILGAAENVA